MKHIGKIQAEFLKEAAKWDDLSPEAQRKYLQEHRKSKRRLTAKPGSIDSDNAKFKKMKVEEQVYEETTEIPEFKGLSSSQLDKNFKVMSIESFKQKYPEIYGYAQFVKQEIGQDSDEEHEDEFAEATLEINGKQKQIARWSMSEQTPGSNGTESYFDVETNKPLGIVTV